MRGEKITSLRTSLSMLGSPPHARGKVQRLIHGAAKVGVTPACAGKRWPKTLRTALIWDHPRMRGEKCAPTVFRRSGGWITPAYAGKRAAWARERPRGKDHPRIRGEKALCQEATCPWVGSPPHTRGKAQDIPRWSKPRRITPAYAGKREAHVSEVLDGQDHPRIRGEKCRCM